MGRCLSCMQAIPDKQPKTCPHCGEPTVPDSDKSQFLKPGSVLQGKFLVGKVLGSGGFGNTYIGWNQVLQCRVAIKEYFPKHLSKREIVRGEVTVTDTVSQQRFRAGLLQFLEEARSIATLQDVKGVIQVYNFFEENGTGYIIMEFLEGMDVKTILKHRGDQVDYQWTRRVMLTVLHTLREIHKRGILHRDIAPDNVFVTKEGVIKLIDFGAAKHATELANLHADVVLKAGYAPIEQYSKKAKQGAYTDLYAVAAMFYRMLTGTKPQPANERIVEDHLLPLSDMGVKIPEQAEMAIMVCLSVQPAYRLQSAGDFMEALGGSDFVPVYEPTWILPEVKEKKSYSGGMKNLSKKKKALILSGALVAAGLVLAGGAIVVNRAAGERHGAVYGKDETLHQYEGQSVESAVRELEQYGITPNVTYLYNPDVKESKVLSMKEAAGTSLEFLNAVHLTAESSQMVTVEDFQGKSVESVRKKLKSLCRDQYRDNMITFAYTNAAKKNTCYAQNISGNCKVEELSGLSVQASWGKKSDYETKMPDLVGMTAAEAKKRLKKLGLSIRVIVTQEIEDETPEGIILWQNLSQGQTFNKNKLDSDYNVPGEVEVTVSRGITVTEPPVVTQRPRVTARPNKKPSKTKAPKSNNSHNAASKSHENYDDSDDTFY